MLELNLLVDHGENADDGSNQNLEWNHPSSLNADRPTGLFLFISLVFGSSALNAQLLLNFFKGDVSDMLTEHVHIFLLDG